MRHTPRDVLDAKDTIDPWREPGNEAPARKPAMRLRKPADGAGVSAEQALPPIREDERVGVPL